MRVTDVAAVVAHLPSPAQGVWHLGPLPIRGYALCIIVGVVAAAVIADRRWRQRGGRVGTVADVATWAVPAGLVGARIYSVCTDPELYFLHGENPWRAFAIWDGGLGIWGAIAGGALAAWWVCRRGGVAFGAMADATAPGLAVAQAIGRFGNYFNQELFGGPTRLPWGLFIDPAHRPTATPNAAYYQPTFFYESLWDLGVAAVVMWADRRYRLGHGRAFWLYVAAYVAGRAWIEALRVDHANHFFGVRLNDWTCLICFILSVGILWRTRGRTRELMVEPAPPEPTGAAAEPDSVSVGALLGGVSAPSDDASGDETTIRPPPRDGP